MCIAILKPMGSKVPDADTLGICYDNNNDGAGYMYARDGKVHIRKGFMKFKDFLSDFKAQHLTDNDTIVFHFRIRTDGKKNQGNTHPFPLSADVQKLKALEQTCEIGMAHNGIINIKHSHKISDTMQFCMDYLSRKAIYMNLQDTAIRKLIEDRIGSYNKIVVLKGSGKYILFNKSAWIEDEGLFYSNTSYKPYSFKYSSLWHEEEDGIRAKLYSNTTECPWCKGRLTKVVMLDWVSYYCPQCKDYFEDADLVAWNENLDLEGENIW